MNIKWIVTDMDGTLLDDKDRIPAKTKEYLLACQKRGIKLIMASGRSYSRLMPYAKELQMIEHGGFLIEVNGMAFYDLQSSERMIRKRLKRADIDRLFPWCQKHNVEVQGYQDQALYYWYPESMIPLKEKERKDRNLAEDYPWVGGSWSWVADNRNGYPHQAQITDAKELPDELNKINCLGDPKQIRALYKKATEQFGTDYEFCRTCPRIIEINPKGITKGQTLQHYMKKYHIQPDEVIAFGDGENDLDVFAQVKYSIAMGNAEGFVKEKALDVTDTNREEGIAKALRKYLPWLDQKGVREDGGNSEGAPKGNPETLDDPQRSSGC